MTRRRLTLAAGALLALGCHAPVTEIVVVVDSDLVAPGEVNRLELEIDPPVGSFMRDAFDLHAGSFPATVGLVPGDAAGYGPFDVTVSLSLNGTRTLVTRKASGVRFVRGAVRMLFLPLPRSCECQGTSCPNALTPACADVTGPTLAAFDPAHLPRVAPADGGAGTGGGGAGGGAGTGGAGGATPDAGAEHPLDAALDDRREDAMTDGARDAATETPPAKLPRGHACGAADACADGPCVDGFCCESACACGECASTPGTCKPVAAGTDPRGACGDYVCDGAGKCEATCTETFGACSASCSARSHCDGAGKCVPSTTGAGFFCVVGSCMCAPPLTCPAPDGGGAGVCR